MDPISISVIIPLYNKEGTLRRALNAVLSQSFSPQEIIIVDDGSTDGSAGVAGSFTDTRIRIIHQQNSGVSAARNRGIEVAKGEWVAFLDADDEWERDYLKEIGDLITRFPDANVCATSYCFGNYLGNRKQASVSVKNEDVRFVFKDYFLVAANSAPPLWTSAVCVRKTAINEIGGFPEGIIAGEDLLTWARLAIRNKIAYSRRPLATFWLEKAHTYHTAPNRKFTKDDYVGEELKKLMKTSPTGKSAGLKKYISLWHKMRASTFLRYGQFFTVFHECFIGLKFDPFNLRLYAYLLLTFLPTNLRLFFFRKLSSY